MTQIQGVVSTAVKKPAEATAQPKKIRKKVLKIAIEEFFIASFKRASPSDDTSIHSLAIDYKKKPYNEDPFSAKISGKRKLLEPFAVDIDQDKGKQINILLFK